MEKLSSLFAGLITNVAVIKPVGCKMDVICMSDIIRKLSILTKVTSFTFHSCRVAAGIILRCKHC